MKALILAAGFGTRLKPHTLYTPKCLFPVAGRPNLDIIIDRLAEAGCDAVMVNTHHLHEKIEAHISQRHYPIPVLTTHEPEILGTGGAIKNLAGFWDDGPFFVINGDVVENVDFKDLFRFHRMHCPPATLVLCDDPGFNTVRVDRDGFIAGYNGHPTSSGVLPEGHLTFTGVQVLDPLILDFIPENRFSTSIAAFEKMMAEGLKIRAFIPQNLYWTDIGSPERYREAVFDRMAPEAFEKACGRRAQDIVTTRLEGDGSDRSWYRLTARRFSMVMADHGIRGRDGVSEAEAFISIGNHLFTQGVPVPEIFLGDAFSGLVFMEDLGNTNLQDALRNETRPDRVFALYASAAEAVIRMSVAGAKGFDPRWTCQSQTYDKELILERECRYFVDAFLNGYLGMTVSFDDFREDFTAIADTAVGCAVPGFMHRDMQSRNIMIHNGRCRFIDFQGGRTGPLQYDLASLIIDPYVDLPVSVQERVLNLGFRKTAQLHPISPDFFFRGYDYCAIARNLQILGAFGFLTRRKGKTRFEQYIPAALRTLKKNLARLDNCAVKNLKRLVENLPEFC
jgi:aminoglycoside/choline kinase family phosphotransferase/dTDP-glucose pyrophosphorylase